MRRVTLIVYYVKLSSVCRTAPKCGSHANDVWLLRECRVAFACMSYGLFSVCNVAPECTSYGSHVHVVWLFSKRRVTVYCTSCGSLVYVVWLSSARRVALQ